MGPAHPVHPSSALLCGSDRSALGHGFGESFADRAPFEGRAAHGDYDAVAHGRNPGPGHGWPGSWQIPTAEFLAGLPREPHLLMQRLHTDSPHHRTPVARRWLRYPAYVGPWVYALDALRTGLVPAALRAALYRTLQLLPGARLATDASNLDGATAVAIVLDRSPLRHEVLIEPHQGHYIGERTTVVAWNPIWQVRSGTVIGDSAQRTQIVDGIDPVTPQAA